MTGGIVRLNEVWKRGLLGGVAVLAFGSAASTALAQGAAAPLPAAPATPATRGQTLGNFNSQSRASSDQDLLTPRVAPPKPADTTADQLLGSDAFYMEADTVVRDDEHHTWTARGGVEASGRLEPPSAVPIGHRGFAGACDWASGDVDLHPRPWRHSWDDAAPGRRSAHADGAVRSFRRFHSGEA